MRGSSAQGGAAKTAKVFRVEHFAVCKLYVHKCMMLFEMGGRPTFAGKSITLKRGCSLHRGVPRSPRFSEGGTWLGATHFPGWCHHRTLIGGRRRIKIPSLESCGIPPLQRTQGWATRASGPIPRESLYVLARARGGKTVFGFGRNGPTGWDPWKIYIAFAVIGSSSRDTNRLRSTCSRRRWEYGRGKSRRRSGFAFARSARSPWRWGPRPRARSTSRHGR